MKTAASVEIKVFAEDHRTHETFRFQAPRGQRYTKDGAMMEMSAFVSQLQEKVPGRIFKVIHTQFNKFNVVHEFDSQAEYQKEIELMLDMDERAALAELGEVGQA